MSPSLVPEDRWKTWDFDDHLEIRRPRPIPADDFETNREEVTREGLETLLLVNLDTVMPDWNLNVLRPRATSFNPPIEAIDPAGVLHLIELHDVRDAPDAISTTISDALARFGTTDRDWLFDPDSQRRVYDFASRIAAFWLEVQSRTDPESLFEELPEKKARRQKLENLVERVDAELDPDALVERTRRMIADRAPEADRQRPEVARDVHLHLVVADSEQLDENELSVLHRLREQGVRRDVWEVRLDADRDRRSGRLGVRTARLPDRRQKHFPALRDRRPTELIAEMARQRPELRRQIGNWSYVPNKRRTILRSALPLRNEPQLGPFFSITTRGDEIEFKTSMKIPETIDETYSLTDLKTRVTPVGMAAVRAWIAEILPPDPAEDPEAARRLEHNMHQGKRWGGYLRVGETGPVVAAKAWHSGGLRSATITVDTAELEPSVDQLATLANTVLETFMRKLIAEGGEPDGWGLPDVSAS